MNTSFSTRFGWSDMKVRITQEGMVQGKWCIEELHDDGTAPTVRCPFDSEEEALARAKEIATFYEEPLEVVK